MDTSQIPESIKRQFPQEEWGARFAASLRERRQAEREAARAAAGAQAERAALSVRPVAAPVVARPVAASLPAVVNGGAAAGSDDPPLTGKEAARKRHLASSILAMGSEAKGTEWHLSRFESYWASLKGGAPSAPGPVRPSPVQLAARAAPVASPGPVTWREAPEAVSVERTQAVVLSDGPLADTEGQYMKLLCSEWQQLTQWVLNLPVQDRPYDVLRVLVVVLGHVSWKDGTIKLSREGIAEAAGLSAARVSGAMGVLAKAGVVSRHRVPVTGFRGAGAAVYRFSPWVGGKGDLKAHRASVPRPVLFAPTDVRQHHAPVAPLPVSPSGAPAL